MGPEQRAHYQMQLDDALKKKKRALVAVCTLGLSETPIVRIFNDSEDTKNQMSFGKSPVGWVFKVCWFLLWTFVTALIFGVIVILQAIIFVTTMVISML